MSKLVEIVQLLQRRLQPKLAITGIIPCLYDSRLRLAREVLAEIRKYFPGPVFNRSIRKSVKLAEAPSYGQSIFQYAPTSPGAGDYADLAAEVLAQEPGANKPSEPTVATPAAEPTAATAPAVAHPVAEPAVASAPAVEHPVVEPTVATASAVEPEVAQAPEAPRAPEPTLASLAHAEPTPDETSEADHTLVPEPAPEAPAAETATAPEAKFTAPAIQAYTDEGTVTAPRRAAPQASDLPPLPESAFRIIEP